MTLYLATGCETWADRGRRTQVVEEARPLVVGGGVGEGGLGDEFVRLVVQVVVQVVAQQQVQYRRLTLIV